MLESVNLIHQLENEFIADSRIYKGRVKNTMAIGYKEMAEINLHLSELCFAAESEVEKYLVDTSESEYSDCKKR